MPCDDETSKSLIESSHTTTQCQCIIDAGQGRTKVNTQISVTAAISEEAQGLEIEIGANIQANIQRTGREWPRQHDGTALMIGPVDY